VTLIAGILSRDGEPLPREAVERIRGSITRGGDDVSVFEDGHIFLAKVDIGAFAERAEIADMRGNVTLLAGEPLIGDGGRARDTDDIHKGFLRGDASILGKADGVFSVVHYQPKSGELLLATDKLGIRPMYYFASDRFVVFASALRILEELAEVPKVMDIRAVTEMVGLGYALADRTPYIHIKALRPAAIIRIRGSQLSSDQYYSWDKITQSDAVEAGLGELLDRFKRAVSRRNADDKTTAAYLSGGLDSRCIVAALRESNVSVNTYNFARPNTQDQIFGREFAAAVGAKHSEMPKQQGDAVPDYSRLMASAGLTDGSSPDRPKLVWSGEGGSVALGHVHLSEEMVEWMRTGNESRAIDEYLQREFAIVSPRIFKNGFGRRASTLLAEGIREEIDRLKCADPARNFYFFLLLNDQHRKLSSHFENIDIDRLEFQLPFFDSSFIKSIARLPIDVCLRHKIYVRWLSLFPSAVRSVAWQVYPGHEACPVAASGGLDYQWSRKFQDAERAARRRRVLKQAKELLGADFPAGLLDRGNLIFAAVAHATRLRDYGHLIDPAHRYFFYSKKCGGRYEMS
jgi:asparagine synthase (glutamine-hydrolysing)